MLPLRKKEWYFFVILLIQVTFQEQLTDEWAITFREPYDINDFVNKFGIIHDGQIGELLNTHLFKLNPERKRNAEYNEFFSFMENIRKNNGEVHENEHSIIWFERQKLIQITRRGISELLPYRDPLLPTQWHLHNLTDPMNHVHINVVPVWRQGITGKGVVICIIDDGIQISHPDLKKNWKKGHANWNFNLRSSDITPDKISDWHGTAMAGLAAAAADGQTCGVGVAHEAQITGIVLLQGDSTHTDAVAAQVISHQYGINHIYSNSWGPLDDGKRKERPGKLTEQAMLQSIEKGRDGLGSLYIWAAGNGRQQKDNCNYDGYANFRYVATFGAIDSLGVATEYSEPCAALIGVLPSGSGRANIITTGLMSDGYCNKAFTGTSAAAPIGAGIAALVLQANSSITWLDFQYILMLSAIKNDPLHWSWKTNGAGHWVSHSYGFGIIDVNRAVDIAKNWDQTIIEISLSTEIKEDKAFYPFQKSASLKPAESSQIVQSTLHVNQSIMVHHVEVIVNIKHNFRGHLYIQLKSPYGTESILAEKHDDNNPDYIDWRFTSLIVWGEKSFGDWTLTIIDKGNSVDVDAKLVSWKLNLYGIEEDYVKYNSLLTKWSREVKIEVRLVDSLSWGSKPVIGTLGNNFPSSPGFTVGETNSLWKIVLMGIMICGIIVMVASLILVFMVRSRREGAKIYLNRDDFIEVELSSYESE